MTARPPMSGSPEIIYSERIDYGGMFDGEIGVYERDGRFFAYAKDGWGAGMQCGRDTLEAAKGELERLSETMFG